MDHCAFIGLEDIWDGLPTYREEVVPVAMEEPLKSAYEELEEEITACLREHRGNSSVASTMLNALLAWLDHPYGFGTLYGSEFDPETKCRESFVIAETVHRREAWYREQLRRGIDVAICHPKIVETGLDLLDFPTILFHETGFSLHTLRQSSRRSWRIGQRRPVEVEVLCLQGNDAGGLSPADGEEAPRCVSDGREVRFRGSPGNRWR
jgi:hypothetical protein